MVKPKQLVSTGKVIWIESEGEVSSPLRFVLEDDKLYFLRNGRFERVPPLSEGQIVRVAGHPLSKQTRSGEATAVVHLVPPSELPRSVLLELSGTLYDPRLSSDANATRLEQSLDVACLELVD